MIFDTASMISSISALIVLLLSWIFNPYRRRFCNTLPDPEFIDVLPLSLVIIVRGNAQNLERNLPLWLSQKYSADLQIIVVTEEGDMHADEILKRLSMDKPIHKTFVPHTSRYMSKNKLAVTLGVKAACHQVVMLVNADCRPASNYTLSLLTQFHNLSNNVIILPFSKFEVPCNNFYQFVHFYKSLYYMHTAINSQAYSCNSNCLIFYKDMFIQGQGFSGNLHLVGGEYEFLINHYSSKKGTAVVIDPLAQIIQKAPTRLSWWSNAIQTKETHSHLERNFKFQLQYIADWIVLYSSYLEFLSLFLIEARCEDWFSFSINTILFCVFIFMRISYIKRNLNLLKIYINPWYTIFYELFFWGYELVVNLRHMLTDKMEFTSYKL